MRRQISAEELLKLYHDIGACIWHMQYLEDALHTFLTIKVEIKQPGTVEPKKAMELLAKHRRATLGTALKVAENSKALPLDLLNELRSLKDERDWLVHRSVHQNSADLYTDEGRKTVFSRLSEIQDRTISLKAEIVEQLEDYCSIHGLSNQQANDLAHKQIAELRGEG